MRHRYGDMVLQSTCTQTHGRTHTHADGPPQTTNLIISSNVYFVPLAEIKIVQKLQTKKNKKLIS